MTTRRQILGGGVCLVALASAARLLGGGSARAAAADHVTHTDAEWKSLLTPAQYTVLRQEGTERPGTSELLHEERTGIFRLRRLRPAAVFVEDQIR